MEARSAEGFIEDIYAGKFTITNPKYCGPSNNSVCLKTEKKSLKMSRIIKKYIRRFYSDEKDVCFFDEKENDD